MSPQEIELIPLSAIRQLRFPLNAIGNLQLIKDEEKDRNSIPNPTRCIEKTLVERM
jgi:hypothetical protein